MAIAGCLGVAWGASLSVVVRTVAGGATEAEVRFAAEGEEVSAIQFDLVHEARVRLSAAAGVSATNRGKELHAAEVAEGRLRVLVTGENATVLEDGTVVTLSLSWTGADASTAVVTDALASRPAGEPIDLAVTDGSILVNTVGDLPTVGVFPQIAVGGGWATTFTLVNPGREASTARLLFRNDTGAGLVLPLVYPPDAGLAGQAGSMLEVEVPAEGLVVVMTEMGEGVPVQVGWAELQSPGGVWGTATFTQRLAEGGEAAAVVPLESRQPMSFILAFDNTEENTTAVALVNRSSGPAEAIQVVARDQQGGLLLEDTIALPAYGHAAFSIAERFALLGGQRGTLEFQTPQGGAIAVLGLQFDASGTFTSVPAAVR